MKLRELLNESPTDVVARLYKEASEDYDRKFNTDAAAYKTKNSEYYQKHFENWKETGITPVFDKPIEKDPHPYTNQPDDTREKSPGYRGLHRALKASNLPYDADAGSREDPTAIISRDAVNSLKRHL